MYFENHSYVGTVGVLSEVTHVLGHLCVRRMLGNSDSVIWEFEVFACAIRNLGNFAGGIRNPTND